MQKSQIKTSIIVNANKNIVVLNCLKNSFLYESCPLLHFRRVSERYADVLGVENDMSEDEIFEQLKLFALSLKDYVLFKKVVEEDRLTNCGEWKKKKNYLSEYHVDCTDYKVLHSVYIERILSKI